MVRTRRALHVSTALGLTALAAGSCTAIDPADEPRLFTSLECGQPLRESCAPRSRTFTSLPSRDGRPAPAPTPPPTPMPAPLQRAVDAPEAAAPPPSPPRDTTAPQPTQALDLGEPEEPAVTTQRPIAGPMTESAAVAKRLFDKSRWSEAVQALEDVAHGRTGDDDGNRQVAEFLLAIALYNMKDYEAATDLFLLISEEPSHLKFAESTLWVSTLAGRCQTRRLLETIAASRDDGAHFRSSAQVELARELDFLRARGLVARGDLRTAAERFEPFRSDVVYGFRARQCLEWIAAQPVAAPARDP